MKKYEYICPSCKKTIRFATEKKYKEYVETQKVCYYCKSKENDLKTNYQRICPECGNIIHYKYRCDYRKALKNNSVCIKCCENSGRFIKGELKYYSPQNTPTYNLNKILDCSIESFYWLGLIISDGSFYKGRFELGLNEKDYNYLLKFANYIGFNEKKIWYREKTKSYRLSFNNQENINEFMQYFGINYRKTYNPIDYDLYFKKYSFEQKLALLIGIIDGDGNIRKESKERYSINITAYYLWEDFYKKLINDLKIDFNIHKIKKRNVIRIGTVKQTNVKKIFEFVNKNNLLYLERKWKKIVY